MSDEMRELLHRGAGVPEPSWGFESVWRRSRRRRIRGMTVKTVTTIGILAVVAISVASITPSQDVDEPRDRIAPADGSATWRPISAAPIQGRYNNVGVWTGEEMLVWGGSAESEEPSGFVDGAAFDLVTQEWRSLAAGPLESSDGRTAVWTGTSMLVWGGELGNGSHARPDNGAAYDPATDSWTELPGSPSWSLASHSAIWTGEEMIVWGGVGMEGDGAAFDPRSNTWRTIAPAPIDGRFRHAAVWTGHEMIVWGGPGIGRDPLATGAAYDPQTDSWRELPPAPISGRDLHSATWTGEEMIVWGGWNGDAAVSDGAAYNPVTDAWRELPAAPIISAVLTTSSVWTGRAVVVVGGGGDLASYSPEQNEWTVLPDPPMGEVMNPVVLTTDGDLILWGGVPTDPAPSDQLSNEGAILSWND